MIVEIFFVRHGESCANAWQKEFLQGTQWTYQDPELTARGIQRSIDYSKPLLYLIDKFWRDKKKKKNISVFNWCICFDANAINCLLATCKTS